MGQAFLEFNIVSYMETIVCQPLTMLPGPRSDRDFFGDLNLSG
jgi:hypothetical protein